MSLETDGEHNKLTVYEIDRLSHALNADTSRTFTAWEEYTQAHTQGGRIVSEEIKHRFIGQLEPGVLKKLKAKVIYSIRGEMAEIGEVDTADYIILSKDWKV